MSSTSQHHHRHTPTRPPIQSHRSSSSSHSTSHSNKHRTTTKSGLVDAGYVMEISDDEEVTASVPFQSTTGYKGGSRSRSRSLSGRRDGSRSTSGVGVSGSRMSGGNKKIEVVNVSDTDDDVNSGMEQQQQGPRKSGGGGGGGGIGVKRKQRSSMEGEEEDEDNVKSPRMSSDGQGQGAQERYHGSKRIDVDPVISPTQHEVIGGEGREHEQENNEDGNGFWVGIQDGNGSGARAGLARTNSIVSLAVANISSPREDEDEGEGSESVESEDDDEDDEDGEEDGYGEGEGDSNMEGDTTRETEGTRGEAADDSMEGIVYQDQPRSTSQRPSLPHPSDATTISGVGDLPPSDPNRPPTIGEQEQGPEDEDDEDDASSTHSTPSTGTIGTAGAGPGDEVEESTNAAAALARYQAQLEARRRRLLERPTVRVTVDLVGMIWGDKNSSNIDGSYNNNLHGGGVNGQNGTGRANKDPSMVMLDVRELERESGFGWMRDEAEEERDREERERKAEIEGLGIGAGRAKSPGPGDGAMSGVEGEDGVGNKKGKGKEKMGEGDGDAGAEGAAEGGENPSRPVKRRRVNRVTARDEGYDTTDPFVDDTEKEASLPKHYYMPEREGFYVCKGPLKLRKKEGGRGKGRVRGSKNKANAEGPSTLTSAQPRPHAAAQAKPIAPASKGPKPKTAPPDSTTTAAIGAGLTTTTGAGKPRSKVNNKPKAKAISRAPSPVGGSAAFDPHRVPKRPASVASAVKPPIGNNPHELSEEYFSSGGVAPPGDPYATAAGKGHHSYPNRPPPTTVSPSEPPAQQSRQRQQQRPNQHLPGPATLPTSSVAPGTGVPHSHQRSSSARHDPDASDISMSITGINRFGAGSPDDSMGGAGAGASSSGTPQEARRARRNDFDSLHPTLQQALELYKVEIAKQSFVPKNKFPPVLKRPLVEIAQKALELDEYHEFISVLPDFLPYNHFTLKKLVKREHYPIRCQNIKQEQEHIIENLVTLINEAFPQQKEDYERMMAQYRVEREAWKYRHATHGLVDPEQEEVEPDEPKKKFRMTDPIKKGLVDVITLENDMTMLSQEKKDLEKSQDKISDINQRKLLYARLVKLWPDGWMTTGEISRMLSVQKHKQAVKEQE